MKLSQAHEGQVLIIKKVNGSGAIKQRLLDMGLGRGEKIYVERYAPLKDPIQLRVKGYSLALRVAEGELIEVEEFSK